MKFKNLAIAAALAVGSIGVAYATPDLIQNGDFSQATHNAPWGFGYIGHNASDTGPFAGGIYNGGSCQYDNSVISGWSGNGGYEIWYPSAHAASSEEPCSYYHSETQQLAPIDAPPLEASPTGSFVGLDGITSPVPHAGISQIVNGLTPGAFYTVSFWWGNTQLMDRHGPTTEQISASIFDTTYATKISSIGSQTEHGWSDWMQESFTFKAKGTSGTLQFLSIGTPNSLPPFAVLTGVSMHRVPEPSELALFGGGLLGLGLLVTFARREQKRRMAHGPDAA